MPQPTLTDVHVDAVLSNVSVAYLQNPGMYIASRVFPMIPVSKKSDKYYVYDKNDWLRDEAKPRGDTQESAGSGYDLSTTWYDCEVYALHKDVGDQTRANADAPINLDRDATEFVTSRIMLKMERDWASKYFGTSVWATDLTGVASAPSTNQFVQWNDYANSDPITDVETGKRAIMSVTGMMPNKMVCGYDTWRYLQHHPDIVSRYQYTQAGVITEQMVARLFGVEELLVAQSIYATNIEAETAAYSFVHGKGALLVYSAPTPGLLTPSAGYTFMWTGVSGGLNQPVVVRRMRMDTRKADRIEAESAWINKVVGTDLGCFFATCVA